MAKNIRNIAIVLVLAALVAVIPSGGRGAQVATQAIWLTFLATLVWQAFILYRQHRVELYGLGDTRRAILYVAAGVITLTFTATSRLWSTGTGEIVWIALLGASAYAIVAVIWSARKY